MRCVDLIAKKRAGQPLTPDELTFLVQGYTTGDIPDYQFAALLMAVCWRGMTVAETTALTLAMAKSGTMLDLNDVAPVVADKHSTGGVGDGTSLIVAPVVAACGVPVGKIAGRGLGFTGGTLDKLESIPGFRVDLDAASFVQQLKEVGLAIAGQSADLVPADGKIYALRDVTATVRSIPLIASSVMSKKIACGGQCIVLDVKVGRGAFMRNLAEARALAEMMVSIASSCGRHACAMLTRMDQPLGNAVGNALEVRQAIDILKGSVVNDLSSLAIVLSAKLLVLAGRAQDVGWAHQLAQSNLSSGAALDKLREMIKAQGGDARVLEDAALLPQAAAIHQVTAHRSGVVSCLDAMAVARAVIALGGGRSQKGDAIDPSVGVVLKAKVGDEVVKGQPVAEIHAQIGRGVPDAMSLMRTAYRIALRPVDRPALVLGEVG